MLIVFYGISQVILNGGTTPTLARCGGVAVGSTLSSHGHKRYGGP